MLNTVAPRGAARRVPQRWRLLPLQEGAKISFFSLVKGEVMRMYVTLEQLIALSSFIVPLIGLLEKKK